MTKEVNLCEKGKVFYVTTAFPPVPAGSSIINRNLLSRFNPASFDVFSTKADIAAKVESFDINVHRIFKSYYFSSRLNQVLSKMQVPSATKKLIKFADKEKPAVIVGVFPDYFFLKVARDAAKALDIPFIAYLHDTISESSAGSKISREASLLQEQVFDEASALLVMSEGMRELYKSKYGIDSTALEHTYLEEIPAEIPGGDHNKEAFWGGDVYAINKNSVKRVAEALRSDGLKLFIASGHDKAYFEAIGLNPDNIDTGFFSKRDEYLETLKKYGILVLALDWPDESHIHRDELATIFPTKTPEYLASGVPILVHCPEDYFLAKFFEKNECGTVVSEKSGPLLKEKINFLLSGDEKIQSQRRNSLKTAKLFDVGRIENKFKGIVDKVSDLKWGEKINYEDID